MLLQQTNLSYYNQSLQVFQTMTKEFTCDSIINNLYCGDTHIYMCVCVCVCVCVYVYVYTHGNYLKMSTNTMERCFLLY